MDREELNRLTEKIIGIAIEVHRELGPGLLESVYQKLLTYLRLMKKPLGLLMNFNEVVLKNGIRRIINL